MPVLQSILGFREITGKEDQSGTPYEIGRFVEFVQLIKRARKSLSGKFFSEFVTKIYIYMRIYTEHTSTIVSF